MSLEILERFKTIFKGQYVTFMNSPYFAKLVDSIRNDNNICDLPNIMLHGPDGMVLELCLDMLLSALTKSSVPPMAREPNNVHKFPHTWHMQYITVDAAVLLSDDRAHLIDHLRHMTSHDCMDPITSRHIIAIKNVNVMTQNMAFALRKMIEDPKYTCLFIFTTSHISKMEAAITSRCLSVRCCVNVLDCHPLVTQCLELNVQPCFLDACLQKSKGNISKFLIILERCHSKNGANMFLFDNFLEARLRTLVDIHENILIFVKAVEDTASRIELSGVRPEAICNTLVDVCQKIKPNVDMASVVQLLVDIQMKIIASNKYSYVFDELLHKLVVLMDV